MLVDEIKFGESVNIEFKREVPQRSEKYTLVPENLWFYIIPPYGG